VSVGSYWLGLAVQPCASLQKTWQRAADGVQLVRRDGLHRGKTGDPAAGH
jgi:hypothetical protein